MTNGQLMDYCKTLGKIEGNRKCDNCKHRDKDCAGFQAKYEDTPGYYFMKYAYKEDGNFGKALGISFLDEEIFNFEIGDFIVFEWNEKNIFKIGWIERILDDGAFIKYERENSAFIPFDKIYKIFNQSIIKETEIDGD